MVFCPCLMLYHATTTLVKSLLYNLSFLMLNENWKTQFMFSLHFNAMAVLIDRDEKLVMLKWTIVIGRIPANSYKTHADKSDSDRQFWPEKVPLSPHEWFPTIMMLGKGDVLLLSRGTDLGPGWFHNTWL